jgi:hypothetical protein
MTEIFSRGSVPSPSTPMRIAVSPVAFTPTSPDITSNAVAKNRTGYDVLLSKKGKTAVDALAEEGRIKVKVCYGFTH